MDCRIVLINHILKSTLFRLAICNLCDAGITSDQVLITASGSNNLQVALWIEHNVSTALRYMVSCSTVSNTGSNAAVKKNVMIIEGTINTANIGQLLPSTKYNCCVIESNVDSTFSEVICMEAVTLTQVCEQTNIPSAATISLTAMLLMTLPCASVLLFIIKKQRKDRKRMIINW